MGMMKSDFKFPGYRRVAALRGRVHMILSTEKYLYVHAGQGLYRISRDTTGEIQKPRPIAYLNDRKSVGISLGDRVIIADGKGILAIDSEGKVRILSSDQALASCRAMAVWDGRLFLGGFDRSPDMICFSSPLKGALPKNLTEGEIWLDGILGIEKMIACEELIVSGHGGQMAVYGYDGIYSTVCRNRSDEPSVIFRGMVIDIDGENMTVFDQKNGKSYLVRGIAGYERDKRIYNYSPCAKDGYRVHKNPHTPCEAEVMSLTNKDGDMIYFSEEDGKRYALYRTEVMSGGKPLKATAYLPDDDSLWIGNEAGGLYLMGGENDDGLFDRHMPEIITTKENTNE